MSEATFGTDGWRGVIARDFTLARLTQVTSAILRYLQDEHLAHRGLVIGYDRRFQSRAFAEEVADTAARYGLNVWLMQDFAPSPAVSWMVRHKNAGAGIVITASHNPPQYSGLKLKEYFGGSARPSTTEKIEYLLCQAALPHHGTSPGRIESIDGRSAYQAALRAFVNEDHIRAAACPIGLDVMHGATGDMLAAPLAELGFEVKLLHGGDNPGFGGINPNPIAAHLGELSHLVRTGAATLGMATDGDGDRLAAIDENGDFLGPQELFPLLLQHLLAQRGERGRIIKSTSTTRMIDRICARYNLPLTEVAVGFKHACQAILDDQVLMAGEESGAPGIPRHLPDRDGQLAALLLLESLGCSRRPLHELKRELQRQFGPLHYRQRNLPLPAVSPQALQRHLADLQPSSVAGLKVQATTRIDCVKWHLENEAWLLLRPSGTESLVRLYAEAPAGNTADALLDHGQEMVEGLERRLT
jgi:phosphomannomutase